MEDEAVSGWRPLCTNCAYPASHVYTTYTSRSNIRLGVCDNCGGFIDPLIEAPPLLLFLDLVLLKPRVFLHLLFNRGSPPRKAGEPAKPNGLRPKPVQAASAVEGGNGETGDGDTGAAPAAEAAAARAEDRREEAAQAVDGGEGREGQQGEVAIPADSALAPRPRVVPRAETVHAYLLRLFTVTLLAEVAVRLASSPLISFHLLLNTAFRVSLELGAQLTTSTALALALLRVRGWYKPTQWELYEPDAATIAEAEKDDEKIEESGQKDGRQRGFLPALIPLVLLYTTLLPLLLQLGLSVWSTAASPYSPQASTTPLSESFGAVAPWLVKLVPADVTHQIDRAWASSNKLWLGTRLLGGMSAGFGLRVLLPTPPLLTTAVVLAGWAAALGVGSLLDSYTS